MVETPRGRTARRAWPHAIAGFPLMEILLAIALIGLLSAGLVTVSAHLIGNHTQTPEEVFWSTLQVARRKALNTEREITLNFDTKTKAFLVADGETTESFPVTTTKDLTIDLLAGQASNSAGPVLVGGELVEQRSLDHVTLYPDGTCQPFRVQFRTNGAAHIIAIDPWTCAQVLPRQNDTP